jgi:hypothetical protein
MIGMEVGREKILPKLSSIPGANAIRSQPKPKPTPHPMIDPSAPEPVPAANTEVPPQAGARPSSSPPPPPPRSFTHAVADGLRSARADAERAARAAAPKVKAAFGQAAYDVSYLSAFGAFFGFALVKEILPNPVKTGFSAGAKRGQQAAESVAAAAAAPAQDAGPAPAAC